MPSAPKPVPQNRHTLARLLGDVVEQVDRVADLAQAEAPPTPIHVITEAVETLRRDVEDVRAELTRVQERGR